MTLSKIFVLKVVMNDEQSPFETSFHSHPFMSARLSKILSLFLVKTINWKFRFYRQWDLKKFSIFWLTLWRVSRYTSRLSWLWIRYTFYAVYYSYQTLRLLNFNIINGAYKCLGWLFLKLSFQLRYFLHILMTRLILLR